MTEVVVVSGPIVAEAAAKQPEAKDVEGAGNMKRLMMILVVMVLFAGCTTPAQQRFAVADVNVMSLYVAKAQPAVEAYCNAAEAQGDEQAAVQLRADTRALAMTLAINADARLDALRTENSAVTSARLLLDMTSAVLNQLIKEAESVATQPAN